MGEKTIMERIATRGINYRKMTLEVRKAEDDKEDSYIVEGYATTFNEPYLLYEDKDFRYFEQVDKDAFTGCDMSDVIMQYDHQGRVFARTSNKTLELYTDEHGLFVRAYLNGTEEGKKLFEEIKGGYTSKMSFGFTVEEDSEERITGKDGKDEYTRTIRKFRKLYDVSAVSLPANDGTEISARNLIDGVINKRNSESEKEKEEAQKREEERVKAEELKKEMDERNRKRLYALNLN